MSRRQPAREPATGPTHRDGGAGRAPRRLGPREQIAVAGVVIGAAWTLAIGFRVWHWPPSTVDAAWNRWMSALANPAAHAVAATCDLIGTGVPAVLCTLAAALLVGWRRGWPSGLVVIAASALSDLNVLALKVIAVRPRPTGLFSVDRSFPSGHTTHAAVLTVAVALLLRRTAAWVLAVSWVVLMAWSRTFLHAHWLSDVLVGAVLGSATAVLVTCVALRIGGSRPAVRVR